MTNQVNVNAVITAQDQASATLKNFTGNVNAGLTKIGIAMAAAGAGLTLFAKSATDYTTQLVKDTKELQRETGTTAQQASALLYVTNRLGIDADKTSQVFGLFSKQIVKTAEAATPASTALGELGVSAKNADGSTRNLNDVLLDTADKFAKMPDGADKTTIALELFGRSGKDMIKVLNLGSQGIKDLEQKAKELGLTLTQTNISDIQTYINSQKNLKDSTNALKIQIGELTAPVLANLNSKLTGVVTTLTTAQGPIGSVTRNFIAFGGPLLTASGGLLTFAANANQAGLSIAGVIGALRTFGPLALIVGATVVILAESWKLFSKVRDTLTGNIHRQDQAEEALNNTLKEQATTLDDVKAATKDLNTAKLDATGASLDLERAQRSYNEAVASYGPKSLEAREAAYHLEEAKQRLADVQQKVADTQEAANQKERELASQSGGVLQAVQLRIDKFAGLAGTIHAAAGEVINLDGVISNRLPPLQGSIQNIQGSVQKLQGSIQNLQGTKIGLQGGAIQLQGSRAEGGPVTAGSPYLVGERGPELIIPERNGSVIPNNKVGGAGTININLNAGAFMGNDVEARKFAQLIYKHLNDARTSKMQGAY